MTNEEIAERIIDHDKSLEVLFEKVQENTEKINSFDKIALSVEKLAVNMEHMLKEQERQGQRLERIEREPVENYNAYKRATITKVIEILVGFVLGGVIAYLTTKGV